MWSLGLLGHPTPTPQTVFTQLFRNWKNVPLWGSGLGGGYLLHGFLKTGLE